MSAACRRIRSRRSNYQLVFSVEGLINEYIEVARVIRDGKITEVESMTEIEELSFDGFPPLEAFQTSGGTSTLPDTFLGKIRELDYKTIRYAGHCEKFKTMIDLGLCSSDEIVVDFEKVNAAKSFRRSAAEALAGRRPGLRACSARFCRQEGRRNEALRYDIVDKQDEADRPVRDDANDRLSRVDHRSDDGTRRRASSGATPQEKAIDPDKFVAELERRDIKVRQT